MSIITHFWKNCCKVSLIPRPSQELKRSAWCSEQLHGVELMHKGCYSCIFKSRTSAYWCSVCCTGMIFKSSREGCMWSLLGELAKNKLQNRVFLMFNSVHSSKTQLTCALHQFLWDLHGIFFSSHFKLFSLQTTYSQEHMMMSFFISQ